MLNLKSEAQQFYQATYGQYGTDDKAVLSSLARVSQNRQQEHFNQAIRDEFAKHHQDAANALDVLEQEYEGNWFTKLFTQSRSKRAIDVYYGGKDEYRATPWEYRLEGMWSVPRNIALPLKQHPVVSVLAIGVLGGLGYAFPLLSAMAGAGMITYSAIGIFANEWMAHAKGLSAESRAQHLQQSGDNLCCLLMTLPGVSGIVKSLSAGVCSTLTGFQEASGTLFGRILIGAKRSMVEQSHLPWLNPAHHAVGASNLETGLVLLGLLDEVMVPFAKIADRFSGPAKSH